MPTQTLACPYCNAQVQIADPVGPRIQCPRCQETFPYRGSVSSADSDGIVQPPIAVAPPRTNRRVVQLVLLLMVVMAAAGLALALWTQKERRKRDPSRMTEIVVTEPAKLGGLGYLPPDTEIVIGVHVGEALQVPDGRELLTQIRLPVGNVGFDILEKWTGLDLGEIDHAVFGLKLEDRLGPGISLAVRSRLPIDTRKVLAALKAGSATKQGKKSVHEFRMAQIQFEGVVWFSEDENWLFVSTKYEAASMPDTPHQGLEDLSAPLRTLVRERLSAGTQLWFAGHIRNWEKTIFTFLLPNMPEETRKLILSLRTFGAWLQLGQPLRVHGALASDDEAATKTLQTFVTVASKGAQLFGGQWAGEALTKQLLSNLKIERKGTWLNLQSQVSAETVKQSLTPRESEKKNGK